MKYKIPSLHNISAYKKAVMAFPNLEEGKEHSIEDLVHSHLKLVVALAAKYHQSEFYEDLIQIGNLALIKSAETFDPSFGYTFATYAMSRVTYDMQNAYLEMAHPIKLITTKPLKKAYNNMPKYRTGNKSLTTEQIKKMASDLNIREEDVIEAEARLYGTTFSSINEASDDEEEYEFSVADTTHEPIHVLQELEYDNFLLNEIPEAMSCLNDRERDIVKRRYLSEEPPTLAELGIEYGVSTERIRQIEGAALKKMKKQLVAY